jgi:hypothetical protein
MNDIVQNLKSNMMIFLSIVFTIGILTFFFSCNSKSDKKKVGELTYGFSRVADTIKFYDTVLDEVDAPSFEILDEYFCKDKNQVFYHTTFRRSQDYFLTKGHNIQKLNGIDAATFVSLDYGYGKDSLSAWHKATPFEVSDIQSLSVIDFQFTKDKNHVYVQCKKVPNILGQSFERINTYYAKDALRYYYILSDGEKYTLKNIVCDYNSYIILDFTYSKDKEHAFYNGEKIQNATSENFQIINAPYSKDHQNVYFESSILQNADPATFELYTENELSSSETYYARDKNSVFVNDKIFSNIDKASFRILNEKYCMDKNGVYFQMKIVKEAHAATFSVFPHIMGDADAEDKKNRYFEGKIVPK